jgi:hypothetical protein
VRRLALLALALVLAGCGGDARGAGTASLWVTRDRGAHVVYTGTVPAGLTAMQALDRKLDIETRYGGRFVQSIEGISGSLTHRRDWFWFLNGVEGDRSAAEYRLRPGDVEWWDFRSWGHQMSVPVVAGAFPEPFLHGFGGVKAGATVVGPDRAVARRIARLAHGSVHRRRGGLAQGNVIRIAPDVPAGSVRMTRAGRAVLLVLGVEAARRLARDPAAFRFRYEVAG